MSPPRRFLLAGLLVGAAEGALGVLASPVGLGPYLWACAAASVALAFAAYRLLGPRRGGPGDGDDDGGLGRGPDDDPPPPPWWPDFEDAFRAHVRERDREPV